MTMSRKIVLLMTDTQRADMLNCYRDTGLKTPNLDRLAENGLRFTKAYTCSPVCAPARSALFTGIWPHGNGVWGNDMPLGDNIKTIGQRLSPQGVHCAYVGKWHLDGHDYFGDGLCPQGWDENYWYDMRRYLDELPAEDRIASRKMSTVEQDIAPEFTYAHRCSNKAIDFLRKHSTEDFFLVISYDEPHGPCLCPKSYVDGYRDYEFPKSRNVRAPLTEKPGHQQLWAKHARIHDNESYSIHEPEYFGCNSFVDDEIGRVIQAVEQHAPDAVIIYTADHGDMLGSHSLSSKGPAAYEEILNIPLLIQ